MKYKLQRKKMVYKSTLNNSKWAVSILNEEREIEKYNNRVKQNLNYTETDNIYTSTMGELKHTKTTAAKETLGNLKQQPRKPRISEKNHNPNGTKKETQT
jgi:hypothetical protein